MAVTINASTSTGLVQSADTSGEIELQSNGTTALKVNTNEGIQILNCLGVGNATPSTSGAGITFPATASASTDANTLDDYEEGTWTPVIADASTGGNTGTYTNAGSYYTKIGNTVNLWAYLSAINTTGMTSGNAFCIRNLPFQSAVFATGNFYTYRVARNASTVSSCATASNSTPSILFNVFTTNSATTDLYITVGNMVSGTSEFFVSITYKV
jgi:hypothetical protein